MKQRIKIPEMEIEVETIDNCEFVATGEYRPAKYLEYYFADSDGIRQRTAPSPTLSYVLIFKKAKPEIKLNYPKNWEIAPDSENAICLFLPRLIIRIHNSSGVTASFTNYEVTEAKQGIEDAENILDYLREHGEFPEVG